MMSLENFKNRKIEWDTVNKNFNQSVQIVSGDVNSRTLTIAITDNGEPIDLTGYSVKLIYKYIYNDSSGFVMLTPTDAPNGEFSLTIPTEMTVPGSIKSNLILLNENLEQVIVSKNLKFISDDSTVTDLAQEVNSKIDDFTKLLLENMPQVMRSELNDLHAQTESNTSNIDLKANSSDMTSLQSAMNSLQSKVEAFGITPENLVTIKSLLEAIANSATDSEVAELINSVNVLTNNISLMSNGDYSPKANQTDLESLQSVVNNQSATISTKANQTDLDNLQTTTSQGIANADSRIDNLIATAGNGNSSELSDIRVGDDGITYDLAGNAVRTQFKNIKKDIARFVAKKDLISGFLNANIMSDGVGVYKLTANATSLILFFPVVSGKTYTVNKGYSMSAYPRLAYSKIVPTIGGAVTGYVDFSVNATYNEFVASQTGYAVIKISYPNDVATLADVQNSVFAYEGSYDSGISKNAVDLSNIRTLDDINIGDLNKKIETISKINIVSGYLNAQVTASAITKATDNAKLSVYFPVKKGMTYTIDKKNATNHTRIGYTANVPNYGDVPSNFFVANNGKVLSNWTFTSAQDGYAIAWILDTSSNTLITFDQIKNNLIVYEGYYDQSYAIDSTKINAVNIDKTFYCGPTRSLTTLKAGLEEATKFMDSTLYVDPGTYDLIQEFGKSWFDNLGTTTVVGLQLKNRVHVIFSPQSKIISHYTGTNANAMSLYSPFNAGIYGFTIENLTLECSNCRYAVHDERNGATEQYKAHYINCSMKIDNSNNSSWGSKHNIGGGLGTNAEIIIENCTFESDDASVRWGVSYHITNRIATDPAYKCKVTIKDNYFKTGGISLNTVPNAVESTVGTSDYVFSNNSFPVKYAGTDAQGIFSDLQYSSNIMAWNNNFRG